MPGEAPLSASGHGVRPEDRPIKEYLRRGVVLIDKPRGPTSHQISAWVRNLIGAEKAGHAGTLDPNVTGVLPIALDDAAKALGVMHLGSKEYVGILKLHGRVSKADLERVFKEFTGPIYQVPPVRAAVKRERRIREIYDLQMLETSGPDVLFRVECEAGTYIRTLCKDIGDALAVSGHMLELRRTRSGHFGEESICTLHMLKDAHVEYAENGNETELRRLVLPFERMFDDLPKVYVKDSAVDAICHGADVAVPGIQKVDGTYSKGDTVAVMTLKGEAVAIGEGLLDSMEALGREKGNAISLKRVLMSPGTYPKLWKRGK